jgi:hypothetical protein
MSLKRGGKDARSRVRLAVVTCPPIVLLQWVRKGMVEESQLGYDVVPPSTLLRLER